MAFDLGSVSAVATFDTTEWSSGIDAALTKFNQFVEQVNQGTAGIEQRLSGMGLQSSSVDGVGISLQGVTNKAQGLDQQIKSVQQTLSGLSGLAPLAGIDAGIKNATDAYIGLDKAITNVAAEMGLGNLTAAQTAQQLGQIAVQTGQDVTVLAQALYKMAAAGYQGSDGMTVMTAAAKAATAGQTDVIATSQALIAILGSYANATNGVALSTNDADAAMGVMMKTVNGGVLTVKDYAENVAKVASLSAEMGISQQAMGAAIDVLTRNGLTATQAFNEYGAILSGLLKPSKDLAAHFQEDSITSCEALIAARGFGGALEYVKSIAGTSDTELAHLFTNIRATKGEVTLASGEFEGYSQALAAMGSNTDAATALTAAFNVQQQAVSTQLAEAGQEVKQAAISFGGLLVPALVSTADLLASVANWFIQLPQPIQQLIAFAAVLAAGLGAIGIAASILGPVIGGLSAFFDLLGSSIGLVSAAFDALTGPVGLIIAAAALVVANWQTVVDFFGNIGGWIGSKLAGLGGAIGDGFKTAWHTVEDWFAGIGQQLQNWGGQIIGFLAQGIIDSVPLLGGAVSAVSNFLSFQWVPHSPPPGLPWLREAGAGWLRELGAGLTDGDFSFINSLSQSLQEHIREALGPSADQGTVTAMVFGDQSAIAEAVSAIEQGGQNVEQIIAQVNAGLRDQDSYVLAVVDDYLRMADVAKQIVDLQTKETSALDQQKPALDYWTQQTAQVKTNYDAVNRTLTDTQNAMRDIQAQLTLQQDQQAQAEGPVITQLNNANAALKQQQQNQQDIITSINDKATAERGYADQALAAANAPLHALEEQRHQRDAYYAALKLANEGNATALTQIDAAQRAEYANSDLAINNARAQAQLAQDAHGDKLTQIQQEQSASTNAANAQAAKDNATLQQQIAGLTAVKAIMVDLAQQANEPLQSQIQSLKIQADGQQIIVNKAKEQYDAYKANSDALQQQYDKTKTSIDAQVVALQQELTQKQAIYTQAKDRLGVEDQIITAINQQTTAAAAAAAAAAKASAAAAGKGGPFDTQIDTTQHSINEETIDYHAKLAPIIAAEQAARDAGDTAALKALQAQKTQIDANHQSTMDYLNAQQGVWKDANQQVADGVATQGQAFATAQGQLDKMNQSLRDAAAAALAAQQAAQQPHIDAVHGARDDAAAASMVDALTTADKLRTANLDAAAAEDARATALKTLRSNVDDLVTSGKGLLQLGLPVGVDGVTNALNNFAAVIKKNDPEDFNKLDKALSDLSAAYATSSQAIATVGPLANKLGLSDTDIAAIYNNSYKGGKSGITGYTAALGDMGSSVATTTQDMLHKAVVAAYGELGTDASGTPSTVMAQVGSAGLAGFIAPIVNGITTTQTAMQNWLKGAVIDFSSVGLGIGEGSSTSTVFAGFGSVSVNSLIDNFTSSLKLFPFTKPLSDALTNAHDGASSYIGTAQSGPFHDLGDSADTGLAGGIYGGIQGLVNAGLAMAAAAKSGVQTGFKSQSPSQEMFNEGTNAWIGLRNGMDAGRDPAYEAARQMALAATGGAASGVKDGSNAVQQEIYKLIALMTGRPVGGDISTQPLPAPGIGVGTGGGIGAGLTPPAIIPGIGGLPGTPGLPTVPTAPNFPTVPTAPVIAPSTVPQDAGGGERTVRLIIEEVGPLSQTQRREVTVISGDEAKKEVEAALGQFVADANSATPGTPGGETVVAAGVYTVRKLDGYMAE